MGRLGYDVRESIYFDRAKPTGEFDEYGDPLYEEALPEGLCEELEDRIAKLEAELALRVDHGKRLRELDLAHSATKNRMEQLEAENAELRKDRQTCFGDTGDPPLVPQRPPTHDECAGNWIVYQDEHSIIYADYHPQWGGYAGRCWVSASKGDGCFDVVNYHDGEFPRDENPTVLHYCMLSQLIDFAETIERLRTGG